MYRHRGLYFLCGIIIYIMANLIMFSHINVFAHDIKDYSIDEEIEVIENIDQETDSTDDEGVLVDRMGRITQINEDEINYDSSDDIQDNSDDIHDNSDDSISSEINPVDATIIFSFGCVIGLIVGGMLLGWIK